MSSDLKSEIEARKARIAELRRQRVNHTRGSSEAHLERSGSPGTPQQLTLAAASAPLIEIEPPVLYQRITQTDPVIGKPEEYSDEESLAIDNSTKAPEQEPAPEDEPKPFTIAESLDQPPPDLIRFLDNAWRAVARSDSVGRAAPIRDYTTVGRATSQRQLDQSESNSGLYKTTSYGESLKTFDWSPFFEDLAVVSGDNETRAYIWSTEAPEHPEFTLRAPTVISCLQFSAKSPNHVYGGGMNGQVFLWDLKDMTKGGGRYDHLPQLRSPAESSPIISLRFAAGSSSLVSINGEGILSVWSSDVLSAPQHRLPLDAIMRQTLHTLKIGIVVPTAMALFHPPDYGYGLGYGTGLCVVGTLTGHLLRVPSSETAQSQPFEWHHAGPITSLSFRRLSSTNNEDGSQGTFLLSGGLDWRIKLWYVPLDESESPVEALSLAIDFSVRDLQWHPTLSTVFAAVGDSQLQLWDFSQSTTQPQLSLTSSDKDEYTVVRFGSHASRVAVGGPKCGATIYNFAEKQFGTSGESWLASLVYKLHQIK